MKYYLSSLIHNMVWWAFRSVTLFNATDWNYHLKSLGGIDTHFFLTKSRWHGRFLFFAGIFWDLSSITVQCMFGLCWIEERKGSRATRVTRGYPWLLPLFETKVYFILYIFEPLGTHRGPLFYIAFLSEAQMLSWDNPSPFYHMTSGGP